MIQAPPLPDVHITIMQPTGYVHSLGLVDPARHLRHQLRRFGVNVTIAKNRLRSDAINFVFGAHLGFPEQWREKHACLFVNLEQLGHLGAKVPEAYLRLLKTSGVVDYDLANLSAYGADPADVPLLSFRHAPYLDAAAAAAPPLEDRPIDLLFFGSMNERRRRIIERIEACGVSVAMFDHPLYGEERDQYIRQAKAVLNCHYYESATFEQVRTFHCLSLGTPVISERSHLTRPDPVFDEAIAWFDEASLESFFARHFAQPRFFEQAREQLRVWRRHDPVEAYADVMAFAAGYFQGHASKLDPQPWRPERINLGSGKDYRPGWLNLDVIDRAEPDVILDLGQPQELPWRGRTRFGLEVELQAGTVDEVYANNVLEHVPDLCRLMTNVLTLLKDGGEFSIEVPYERAPTAWQDPTHVRAMNENSWLYYTDWFWYLGWFEHRFDITASQWLDLSLRPCAQQQAAFMKVTLQKRQTSPHERTLARAMQTDLRITEAEETDTGSERLVELEANPA